MSDVRCQMSDVRSQMSDVRCQSSDVRCQMSDVRCQMSDVRCQMSDVRCQMSDVRCQMSDVRCQMSHSGDACSQASPRPKPNMPAGTARRASPRTRPARPTRPVHLPADPTLRHRKQTRCHRGTYGPCDTANRRAVTGARTSRSRACECVNKRALTSPPVRPVRGRVRIQLTRRPGSGGCGRGRRRRHMHGRAWRRTPTRTCHTTATRARSVVLGRGVLDLLPGLLEVERLVRRAVLVVALDALLLRIGDHAGRDRRLQVLHR
ncbi:MAG: hypothetical protein MAG453_01282 [Calditrichaeota bacterium]|nr:hypothetical protein [Calditrichota bacterium]